MKKICTFMIAVLLLFSSAFAGSGIDEKILPYPIHQKKLSNGLNVVTVPYDSPGLAAFYVLIRAGSRDEIEPGHFTRDGFNLARMKAAENG